MYTNRRQLILLSSAFLLVLLCTIDASSATTQASLLAGAAADRKLIASKVLGGFGWTCMGFASLIAIIEFFTKRDNSIFMYLSFAFVIFFALGRYFVH